MSGQQDLESRATRSSKKKGERFSPGGFRGSKAGGLMAFAALLVLSVSAIGDLSASSATKSASARGEKAQATGRGQELPAGGESPRSYTASAPGAAEIGFRNTDPKVAYVGSKACESCHETEYKKFFQTPHGRATTAPEGRAELKKLPREGVTVCQSDSVRCYRVFPSKDGYSISEFDRSADGKETHAETEKIAFALGSPLIATGYVIQRGDFLFEAPLTYYKEPEEGHVQGWGISPGYGNDAVGFTRPVVDSCLTCHVGRPRPTDAASNRYLSPPFEELSIGCESCHGPGALHVEERQANKPAREIDTSIVNPEHLTAQLADDTCNYCHELGQARVPLPGRSFQDYRPGVPLLRTQAIFKSKLLLGWNLEEWQDEMATSACYRFSKGALRCSSCHDPHYTPNAEQAPAFYNSKCMNCHQSASCTLPLSERQHTQPVDNCIGCHMPKHVAPKLVKLGGRGTSHRILKNDDEPVPTMDTLQTMPDPATGLVLVDSDSTDAQSRLPREVLLSAYEGVLVRDSSRDDLIEHYKALLQDLAGDRTSASVMSALAGAELAKRTSEGNRQAIRDLQTAVDLDSRFPKDYLLLADLEFRAGDPGAAIKVLSTAIERFPYNPTPYQSLVEVYLRAGETAKATQILHSGIELFPADRKLIRLSAGLAKP